MFRQSLRVIRNRTPISPMMGSLTTPTMQSRFYSTSDDTPRNVAVVLSGCGYLDGTEITEAAALAISLSQNSSWKISYFAPTGKALEIYDHSTGALDKNEERDIAVESARISRDKVAPLESLRPDSGIDAVIFPGGYGAGKILSNYAVSNRGDEPLAVDNDIERIIKSFHEAKKPLGFMCLSTILAGHVLGTAHGGPGLVLTSGSEEKVGADIESWGNTVKQAGADSVVVDDDNKVLSTPAYLVDNATPHDIFQGTEELVSELDTLFRGGKKRGDSSVNLGDLDEVMAESLGKDEWAKQKAQIFRRNN